MGVLNLLLDLGASVTGTDQFPFIVNGNIDNVTLKRLIYSAHNNNVDMSSLLDEAVLWRNYEIIELLIKLDVIIPEEALRNALYNFDSNLVFLLLTTALEQNPLLCLNEDKVLERRKGPFKKFPDYKCYPEFYDVAPLLFLAIKNKNINIIQLFLDFSANIYASTLDFTIDESLEIFELLLDNYSGKYKTPLNLLQKILTT